jgi:hypothetical protein
MLLTASADVPQKFSGSWPPGIRNALNARVGFRRTTTVSIGKYETERAEWFLEIDAPTGVTIDQIQDDLEASLNLRAAKWRAKFTTESPLATNVKDTTSKVIPSTPTTVTSPSSPSLKTGAPQQQRAPLKNVSSPQALDSAEISNATWNLHSTGRGEHTLGSQLPRSKSVLENGPKDGTVFEGFRYKIWADSNGIKRVSRWQHRGADQ